jgi:hypothetical protein
MLHNLTAAPFLLILSMTSTTMGGGKGKKDVNAKLTTNFINILKYKTNHL